LLTGTQDWQGEWGRLSLWVVDEEEYEGFTVRKRSVPWNGLGQYYDAKPNTTYAFSFYAKASEAGNIMDIFTLGSEDWSSPVVSPPIFANQAVTTEWKRYSVTFTTKSGGTIFPSVCSIKDVATIYVAGYKLEEGRIATDWSPNPADPEYNEWYYSLTGNVSIPYSGTVPCNQLEQGFSVELTARSSASSLSFKIDDTELTYSGTVASGDVFLFTGFSYTKNGLSIVSKTNKAYFVLQPDKPNNITCNVLGTVIILGFQNLYA
jgi:hypothetical protein